MKETKEEKALRLEIVDYMNNELRKAPFFGGTLEVLEELIATIGSRRLMSRAVFEAIKDTAAKISAKHQKINDAYIRLVEEEKRNS